MSFNGATIAPPISLTPPIISFTVALTVRVGGYTPSVRRVRLRCDTMTQNTDCKPLRFVSTGA